tara:strand:- start:2562 stop:2780 length:219 start_codon:yes stop_codon:yes gene_type:complete
MYETKDGFDYKSATGNTLKELIKDIELRFKELSKRQPKLIQVLYLPKKDSVNITSKVLAMIKPKPFFKKINT